MRSGRLVLVILTAVVVGSITFAQPGRGGSQWLTTLGDAQRTSWVRTDDKISVEALSKPGFDLQWKVKLDNQARGLHGLGQGVTASGVTLFVPMSLVTGSSNNVYAIDNDIGYVVWQRHFEAPMPAVTPACAGGITSAATRIVRLDAVVATGRGSGNPGRANVGYRSLLGEPGQGVPLEGRASGPVAAPSPGAGARGTAPNTGTREGGAGRAAAPVQRPLRNPCPGRVADRRPNGFPGRHEWKRAARSAFSFVPPALAMWCRATACCTLSAWRRARTSSGQRHFFRRTRDGLHPSR